MKIKLDLSFQSEEKARPVAATASCKSARRQEKNPFPSPGEKHDSGFRSNEAAAKKKVKQLPNRELKGRKDESAVYSSAIVRPARRKSEYLPLDLSRSFESEFRDFLQSTRLKPGNNDTLRTEESPELKTKATRKFQKDKEGHAKEGVPPVPGVFSLLGSLATKEFLKKHQK